MTIKKDITKDFMCPLERWVFNKALSFNASGSLKDLAKEAGIDYYKLYRVSKRGMMRVEDMEKLMDFIRRKEFPNESF